MSLLHRIPPLVSAIAFGYGVGMTAPETALVPVRAAVGEVRESASAQAPIRSGNRPLSVSPVRTNGSKGKTYREDRDGFTSRMGGPESNELGRLRDVAGPEMDRGESCSIDRPMFSRPLRQSSLGSETNVTDPDDLDMAGTEALSRLQMPDLKLTMTRRTLKYVNFFARTDKGRRMFETWLRRSGKFQDLIQHELREWRLPEDLIWVSMIESGFDARVKSPAGAVGLWQFMPSTGAVYGLVQNKHVDQRKNPKMATTAAAHHLRDLYMRFGSWDLALAAYNMGYEQLLDRIDQYGTADFNELARQDALPSETASYVPKIAAAALIANNLERFGFDQVEIMRPVDGAEIAVPPRLSLKTLAKAAGVSVKTIRSLNPDLLGDKVPPGHGDFILNIPPESLSRAHATLPVLLQTEPIAVDDASVLDPVDLVGGREARLRPSSRDGGSLLSMLPSYKKRRALRDPVEELVGTADDDQGDDDFEVPEQRRRVKRGARKTLLYKVGPGDTLLGVARQFAMDVDDVAKENHIDDDSKLRTGAILKLRVKPSVLGSLDERIEVVPHDDKADAADAKEAKGSHREASEPKTEAKRSARDKGSAVRSDRPRG